MTGLLGGTFDPPHYGHLVLALEAFERFKLEKVLLVPSRHPPHKHGQIISDFQHRYQMTRLAVCDSAELEVADLEPREKPSWTVNLLENLTGMGLDICFIIGMDSLEELHTWREPGRIFRLARVVAGCRPGYSENSAIPEFNNMVETFEMPGLNISSSDLRDRFARGLNTRYLLPENVRRYIRENDLYAGRKSN